MLLRHHVQQGRNMMSIFYFIALVSCSCKVTMTLNDNVMSVITTNHKVIQKGFSIRDVEFKGKPISFTFIKTKDSFIVPIVSVKYNNGDVFQVIPYTFTWEDLDLEYGQFNPQTNEFTAKSTITNDILKQGIYGVGVGKLHRFNLRVDGKYLDAHIKATCK